MNPENGYCRGCYRTLDEIACWSELTNYEKVEIWKLLKTRKPQTPQSS
ncbi:DUF1289 domain-containing protein [Polynucleobacter necessarius]|nr:DUF1289 domain-containing protein [Polynucleobacter necessarius]